MSMSFTGPTCQPLLRIFRSRSGITSQLAFRSGTMLQSTLGHKSLLCIICGKSVFLLCQDMELVLDCKVGLGVNDCLGGGILIGSPERSCSKSISSVNACWKLSFAVTTRILVILREIHVSSIVVSFGSLNAVIFAMSSQFACSWTLLYYVCTWSHFSLTVANSWMIS